MENAFSITHLRHNIFLKIFILEKKISFVNYVCDHKFENFEEWATMTETGGFLWNTRDADVSLEYL